MIGMSMTEGDLASFLIQAHRKAHGEEEGDAFLKLLIGTFRKAEEGWMEQAEAMSKTGTYRAYTINNLQKFAHVAGMVADLMEERTGTGN